MENSLSSMGASFLTPLENVTAFEIEITRSHYN